MAYNILRQRAALLWTAAACIIWSAVPARAAVLRYLSLDDQCDQAEVIVVATAGERSSFWSENGGRIYTDTPFQVEQAVKGGVSGTVTVRQLGGQVGDVAQAVAGTPEFAAGERYVLFLEARPDGKFRVVGFSQGCYPVVEDAGGKARVMPSMAAASGAHFIDRPQGAARSTQSLAEFLARIRLRLAQER
ncbi:MAG: hypothetical protein JXQ83_13585 [Candidatus Glassbacteria bacterium]|nr:hypothetical protein [Candidatus Glassbacteria bacterium]